MIMGFSVSNFKTFDYSESFENQTISFVAGKARSKPEHIFKDADPSLLVLKTGMIFGANSAGKSNLIGAIKALKTLVISENWQKTLNTGNELANMPSLVKTNWKKPITFKIIFKTPSDEENINLNNETSLDTYRSNVYEYTLSISEKYEGSELKINVVSESLYLYDFCGKINIFSTYSTDNEEDLKEDAEEYCGKFRNHAKIAAEIDDIQRDIQNMKKKLEALSNEGFDPDLHKTELMLSSQYDNLRLSVEKINHSLKTCEDSETLMRLREERLALTAQMEKVLEAHMDVGEKILAERNHFSMIKKEISSLKTEIEKKTTMMNMLMEDLDRSKYRLTITSIDQAKKTVLQALSFKESRNAAFRNIFHSQRLDESQVFEHCSKAFKWFNQTLEVISPVGSVFPPMGPDRIDRLSPIIATLDLHIKKVAWVEVTDEKEISDLLENICDGEKVKIESCYNTSIQTHFGCSTVISQRDGLYMFSFWNGERAVKKLSTFHSDMIPRNLEEESAGTKRLIQLSSILLDTREDKVYIVDELDAKIHPLLIQSFVKQFLDQSSEKKQLIFSTHDTGLFTNEMFRSDEIWFVERGDDYSSIISYEERKKRPGKRIEDEYLEGRYGGIPKIS